MNSLYIYANLSLPIDFPGGTYPISKDFSSEIFKQYKDKNIIEVFENQFKGLFKDVSTIKKDHYIIGHNLLTIIVETKEYLKDEKLNIFINKTLGECFRYFNNALDIYRYSTGRSHPNKLTIKNIEGTFVVFEYEENKKLKYHWHYEDRSPLLKGGVLFSMPEELICTVRKRILEELQLSPHMTYLMDAKKAIDEGRYDEAIVLSQISVEMLISKLLKTTLINQENSFKGKVSNKDKKEIDNFLKSVSFRHKLTLLQKTLLGYSFDEDPILMEKVKTLTSLRNSIVHSKRKRNKPEMELYEETNDFINAAERVCNSLVDMGKMLDFKKATTEI
jgi:hypothetical protein